MYKYTLLGFDQQYPAGGMNDVLFSFIDENGLYEKLKTRPYFSDVYQVLNHEAMSCSDIYLVQTIHAGMSKEEKFDALYKALVSCM